MLHFEQIVLNAVFQTTKYSIICRIYMGEENANIKLLITSCYNFFIL